MKLRVREFTKKDGEKGHQIIIGMMNTKGEGIPESEHLDMQIKYAQVKTIQGSEGPFQVAEGLVTFLHKPPKNIQHLEHPTYGSFSVKFPGTQKMLDFIDNAPKGTKFRLSVVPFERNGKEMSTYNIEELDTGSEIKPSKPKPKKEVHQQDENPTKKQTQPKPEKTSSEEDPSDDIPF